MHRAGQLATYGGGAALGDLNKQVRWRDGGAIEIGMGRGDQRHRLDGKGLLFLPSVFVTGVAGLSGGGVAVRAGLPGARDRRRAARAGGRPGDADRPHPGRDPRRTGRTGQHHAPRGAVRAECRHHGRPPRGASRERPRHGHPHRPQRPLHPHTPGRRPPHRNPVLRCRTETGRSSRGGAHRQHRGQAVVAQMDHPRVGEHLQHRDKGRMTVTTSFSPVCSDAAEPAVPFTPDRAIRLVMRSWNTAVSRRQCAVHIGPALRPTGTRFTRSRGHLGPGV